MANSRVYRYSLRAPATLNGAASGTSNGAPCKGAKYVILHFKSTDATDVLSAAAYNVANDPLLWLAGAGQGYASTGNVTSFRMDRLDGMSLLVLPSQVHGVFQHDYIQATFTAAGATPANDISGFEVTAEVFYEDDADQAFGQTLAVV